MSRTYALLRSIIDNPEDTAVRLVFADWLEESGEDLARAELIRTQIEILQIQPGKWEVISDKDGEMHRVRWSIPDNQGRYQWVRHYPRSMQNAAQRQAEDFNSGRSYPKFLGFLPHAGEALYKREYDLLQEHGLRWVHQTFPDWLVHKVDSAENSFQVKHGSTQFSCEFRNGFVEKIRCTMDAWYAGLGHGPMIVNKAPVTYLNVTDKLPGEFSDVPALWQRNMSDVLEDPSYIVGPEAIIPGEIFDLMEGAIGSHYFVVNCYGDRRYTTITNAKNDLSHGSIKWARQIMVDAREAEET